MIGSGAAIMQDICPAGRRLQEAVYPASSEQVIQSCHMPHSTCQTCMVDTVLGLGGATTRQEDPSVNYL